MTLLRPEWLWAMALLVAAAFWLRTRTSSGHWHTLMSPHLLAFLKERSDDEQRLINRYLLVSAGFALALTGPAIPDEQSDGFVQLDAWVLALDLSRSMDANDVQPSRLVAAREQLQTLASRAGARSVAVVGYAGDAFLLTPFSTQLTQLHKLLPSLDSDTIDISGSRTERALSLAATLLRNSQVPNGRVILLTDASDISDKAIEIAGRLNAAGQTVDTIVFATEAGARIPGTADSPVIKPDFDRSKSLSSAGGGQFVHSDRLGRLPDAYLNRLDNHLVPDDLGLLAAQPVGWHDLSHWLLLLLTIPTLFLFRHQTG